MQAVPGPTSVRLCSHVIGMLESARWVSEVTYPGDYEIGILVAAFDTDSVHYELGIFLEGTCLGVADAVGTRGELSARSLAPGGPS